jgi:hypothetical protein
MALVRIPFEVVYVSLSAICSPPAPGLQFHLNRRRRGRSVAMLRRTRHFKVRQTWKQERAPMSSALPRWPSANVRYGMTLTLREAMDSDVVARWKRSNRQARKAGSIFGGRVRSRSATAQQYGTLGSTSTTSSDRYRLTARLLVSPLGHRGHWSSPRSSDAGRLSIECNDRPFRLWPIDVTGYDLK